MNANSPQWKRYREVCEAVLNGTATSSEHAELESLVLNDDSIKKDFTARLHLESGLQLRSGDLGPVDVASTVSAMGSGAMTRPRAAVQPRVRFQNWLNYAVLAAIVLVGIGLWIPGQPGATSQPIATMGKVNNCRWVSSDSPTFVGASLVKGRLILDSGIAELNFDRVALTLEGPVDLELIDRDRCRVRSGRVYAEVHPGGEGFVVETPTSILTDRGTRFGVNVAPWGASDLTVIEGLVDAEHVSTGEVIPVRTDGALRFTREKVSSLMDPSEANSGESSLGSIPANLRPVQLTTAIGDGRDAYVISGKEKSESDTSGMLLVKNPPAEQWGTAWRRRTYLHFDLSLTSGALIQQAKLRLQGLATGMGYRALTTDTTIAVYGITDESLERWDEKSLDWDNCPGVMEDRLAIDPESTVLLGKFVVPINQVTGDFGIEGDQLVKFLLRDTNGGASFILVSETIGRGECYVHGFAGKHHPDLQPPTLRLGVSQN